MDLIISILFFILINTAVLIYLYLFIIFIKYIIHVLKHIKPISSWQHFNSLKNNLIPEKSIFNIASKRAIIFISFIVFVLNSALYVKERTEWVNDKHAYLDAKEYYAVGNVLFKYRSALSNVLFPENKLLKPLEYLQRTITNQGLKLIPNSDAEWAMWEFHFYQYLYIRRTHLPLEHSTGTSQTLKPSVVEMMQTAYKSLDDLKNKPMLDKQFDEKEKYLAYSLIALFYNDGFIFKYSLEAGIHNKEAFYKDKKGLITLKNVVLWMENMKKEWITHPEVIKYMKEHPKHELAHITTILLNLRSIVEHQMYNGEYRCDDKWLAMKYKYWKQFNAEDSVRFKIPKKEQWTYHKIVNLKSKIISYTGVKLCGYKRMHGDYVRDHLIRKTDYISRNQKLSNLFQLYPLAKNGIEKQIQENK